jgi:peroxiredoxin
MVSLQPPICEFGWKAVDFDLKGVDGRRYALADVQGENGTLVMFICNHCPYVKSVINRIIRDVAELKEHGIGAVAIMVNDPAEYPDDSFDNMKRWSAELRFPFPYVVDPSQQIGRDFGAICTPDFFGFNKDLELQYRGRLDESRKEAVPGAARDLFEAMVQIAKTGEGPREQISSMGCSIKWRDDSAQAAGTAAE